MNEQDPQQEKKFLDEGVCKKCDKLGYACRTHTRFEISKRMFLSGLKEMIKNVKKAKCTFEMGGSVDYNNYGKVEVKVYKLDEETSPKRRKVK